MRDRFWTHCERMIASTGVVIDRPAGSSHPRFPRFVYPLDYGHLADTTSGDGDGIDVWIGRRRDTSVVGALVTVDLQKRDAEVKLLLGCTEEEVAVLLSAHNQGAQAAALVRRP